MDKVFDRKSFKVGGHWPLWRGWKKRMTTQNRQKLYAKKQQKPSSYVYSYIKGYIEQYNKEEFHLDSVFISVVLFNVKRLLFRYSFIQFQTHQGVYAQGFYLLLHAILLRTLLLPHLMILIYMCTCFNNPVKSLFLESSCKHC